MSHCQTFISSMWPDRNTPLFKVTLYSCHHFLTVHALVNNYCQGWRTERIIFHQKSLTNSLRALWEWQALPLKHGDALVCQKTASNFSLVLCFCCSFFLCFKKKYIQNKSCFSGISAFLLQCSPCAVEAWKQAITTSSEERALQRWCCPLWGSFAFLLRSEQRTLVWCIAWSCVLLRTQVAFRNLLGLHWHSSFALENDDVSKPKAFPDLFLRVLPRRKKTRPKLDQTQGKENVLLARKKKSSFGLCCSARAWSWSNVLLPAMLAVGLL